MFTLFEIIEPSKKRPTFEPCMICLEEDSNEKAWLSLHKQWLHVPCLVEILKINPEPKDPFTNLNLLPEEIVAIEKAARRLNIFCPASEYRNLLWQSDQKLKELENLSLFFHLEEMANLLAESRQRLKEYIYYVAQNKTAMTWAQFKEKIALNVVQLEQYTLAKISTPMNLFHLIQQYQDPNF